MNSKLILSYETSIVMTHIIMMLVSVYEICIESETTFQFLLLYDNPWNTMPLQVRQALLAQNETWTNRNSTFGNIPYFKYHNCVKVVLKIKSVKR